MAFGANELAKADFKLALRTVCAQMLGDAKAKYGPKIWLQLEKESEQKEVLMKSQIPPEQVKTDLSDIAPKEQVYGPLAALTL